MAADQTIEAGRACRSGTPRSLSEIAVDTIVMETTIAHPTDSRLYEQARHSLVVLAGKAGIRLRQNDNRKAPRLAAQVGRHAQARQFRRMRKARRTLKGYTGRAKAEAFDAASSEHATWLDMAQEAAEVEARHAEAQAAGMATKSEQAIAAVVVEKMVPAATAALAGAVIICKWRHTMGSSLAWLSGWCRPRHGSGRQWLRHEGAG